MPTKKKAPMFHVTITAVGNPDMSSGFARMENKNAVILLGRALATMAESMAGEKAMCALVCDACFWLLKNLLKPEVDVKDGIAKFDDKALACWDLRLIEPVKPVEASKPEEK